MNRTHSHRNLLWSGHWPVVFHKRTGTLLYSLFVSWSFYWQSNGRVEGFTMCILSDAYGCSLWGESVAMACHKVPRALHLKKGQFDEKIEELVENATYGGELRIYFNAMFDRLISKDPENDFKSIRFHGNVVVAIADSRNGSGHHVRIPQDITFPFRRENLFVDSQVHYSYANEVCGMTNDWCDSTKWETGMIPFTGSVRKSRMPEYKEQEAAYEQTFRSGKCTFGDMNYKRHRDVRYSNEYPAGCRCPHCGTFVNFQF